VNLHDLGVHWLGIIGTGLVIVAYIPQVTHLIYMRCGEGVSLSAYALWCSASTLLCVYAVIAEEPVFIVLQGYHAAACALILFYGVRYKNSRCTRHQTPIAGSKKAGA
jgi:uncharacterized protein with PQ loop repeat